jgi:hypothetical protein
MVSAAMTMEYPESAQDNEDRLAPKSFLMSGTARLVPVTAKGRAIIPNIDVARPMTAMRGNGS